MKQRLIIRPRELGGLESTSPELPPLPSPLAMARNLAVEATKHVAAGRPTVDAEEKASRLAICQDCPKFRPCDERCSVCGCKMQIKTSWELAKCPEGKW